MKHIYLIPKKIKKKATRRGIACRTWYRNAASYFVVDLLDVFLLDVVFLEEAEVFFLLEEEVFFTAVVFFFDELFTDCFLLEELFFTVFFLDDDVFLTALFDFAWPDLASALRAAAASASVPLVTTCLGVGR